MKTKFNCKILLLVAILLITMCLFSTNMVQATDNTVQATETTKITDPQEILKLIPDTVRLDILESQVFDNDDFISFVGDSLLNEQINTILKNNNINLASMEMECYNDLGWDTGNLKKCTIQLRDKNYEILAEKEISVKYKNSDNYNSADEQYVTNKLKNVKFDLFEAKEIGTDESEYDAVVQENAKKVINDASLTVLTKPIGGAGSDVAVYTFKAFIYKNDILYATKDFEYVVGAKVTIPDNIEDTDEAYINYALPKIKENWKCYTVKGVNKMTGTIKSEHDIFKMDIKNDGTFYKILLNDDDWARVVLKKKNATTENKKNTPSLDTLNLIPNTLTVKEKEIDYLSINYSEIIAFITETLTKANIDLTDCKINANIDRYDIHKLTVSISKNGNSIGSKIVTINYSNTSKYNDKDAEYIQNIANNYSSVWCTFGFDEEMPENPIEWTLESLLTDKSIKYIVVPEGPIVWEEGPYWSEFSTSEIRFFKDDILYASTYCYFTNSREIIIPDSVSDTEEAYVNYALPIIKEQLGNNIQGRNITLKSNGTLWYDVYADETKIDIIRILKKDTFKIYDGITISSNDNVTLSTEKIENTSNLYKEMKDKLNAKGYKDILNAYELKLTSGDLGDGLEITFDIGTKYNGKTAIVLHQKQDGTYEEFEKTVENGKIKITVTELSPFMIAIKDSITTNNKVLDNEPKAGVADYTIFASVIAIISLGGIVTLKFKK